MIERLVPATSEGQLPRAPSAEKSRKSSAKKASSKPQSVKNAEAPEAPPVQVQVVKEADPFDNNDNLNRFAAMGK